MVPGILLPSGPSTSPNVRLRESYLIASLRWEESLAKGPLQATVKAGAAAAAAAGFFAGVSSSSSPLGRGLGLGGGGALRSRLRGRGAAGAPACGDFGGSGQRSCTGAVDDPGAGGNCASAAPGSAAMRMAASTVQTRGQFIASSPTQTKAWLRRLSINSAQQYAFWPVLIQPRPPGPLWRMSFFHRLSNANGPRSVDGMRRRPASIPPGSPQS